MKILVKKYTYLLFVISVSQTGLLVTIIAGFSPFYEAYQVGKGEGDASIRKGLEKQNFEKETLKKVYDIKERNYVSKVFLYGYIEIVKKVEKKLKQWRKRCLKNLWYKEV